MDAITPTGPHLDSQFLGRVKRGYRRAVEAHRQADGYIWRRINKLQAPVHAALMAESDEPLRRIFADPITTDLFYGVDNLCWSVHGKELGDRPSFPISAEEEKRQLLIVAQTTGSVNQALDCLDGQLRQRVEFPNPFRGELGLATSRGVASYRTIHALYQVRRTLELLEASKGTSVIEIGPGMGRPAYYACRAGITDYTTIDLPLGVVRQACFLGSTLGPDKIWIKGEPPELANGRINFLFAGDLPDRRFDVAVNVDSITEMTLDAAFEYAAWMSAHVGLFFSINHGLNQFTAKELATHAFDATLASSEPYRLRQGYEEETFLIKGGQRRSSVRQRVMKGTLWAKTFPRRAGRALWRRSRAAIERLTRAR
jgi:hypothetical protein